MRDLASAYRNSRGSDAGISEEAWYATFALRARDWALVTWSQGGMLARRRARRLESLTLEQETVHMSSVWAVLDFLADNIDTMARGRLISEQVTEFREELEKREEAEAAQREDLIVGPCDRVLADDRHWEGFGVSINGGPPKLASGDAKNAWSLIAKPDELPPNTIDELTPGARLVVAYHAATKRWRVTLPDGRSLLDLPQGPTAFIEKVIGRGEQVCAMVLGHGKRNDAIDEIRLLFSVVDRVRFRPEAFDA